MKTQKFLLGILLAVASPLIALGCGNNLQNSELPKQMPDNTEMVYNENGGMIPAYKYYKITGKMLIIKEKILQNRFEEIRSAEISDADKNAFYKTFVVNKFDCIKNDEVTKRYNDASSLSIQIRFAKKSFRIQSGANSPLSGSNAKRWRNVRDAFINLETKYKDKLTEQNEEFAVIKYDSKLHGFIFKNLQNSNLSDAEFIKVETVIKQAVENYNSKQEDYGKIQDLSEYKFQYIAVNQNRSEKLVWVNAFCSFYEKDWKKEIIMVDDGGSCFFNLKINLSDWIFYDLQVNGEA